jgi:hypothetical protein
MVKVYGKLFGNGNRARSCPHGLAGNINFLTMNKRAAIFLTPDAIFMASFLSSISAAPS